MKQRNCALFVGIGLLVFSACERQARPPEPTDSGGSRIASVNAEQTSAAPSAATANPSASSDETGLRTAKHDESAAAEASAGGGSDAPDASMQAAGPMRTPDVVFVPTPQPVVNKMLELAAVKKGDIVYDLGCGDGRIVVTAAKRYGVKAFGFDVDPKRIVEARENVKKNGVEHLVTIEQKDIFSLDLSPASVVTLYLLPGLNVKLIPQLEKLRPGSRIVSHDFDMKGVVPVKHLEVPAEERSHSVYLWRTPLKKDSALVMVRP